jgi:hypothetical protein
MKHAIALLLLGAAAGWSQTPSALESDPTGWKDLMPASSFAGWTRGPFLTTNAMDPVSQWRVDEVNHVLVCEGNRGHEWLRYDKQLTDAIFHVEFRFRKIENGKGYNSGVMIRNSADGSIWHQAQAGEQGTGWLFGNTLIDGKAQRVNLRSALKDDRVKPAGEWNTYELRAEGPKITLWVNGAVTSEMASAEVLKGHGGLEAEGYFIEFRNIKLKELAH